VWYHFRELAMDIVCTDMRRRNLPVMDKNCSPEERLSVLQSGTKCQALPAYSCSLTTTTTTTSAIAAHREQEDGRVLLDIGFSAHTTPGRSPSSELHQHRTTIRMALPFFFQF